MAGDFQLLAAYVEIGTRGAREASAQIEALRAEVTRLTATPIVTTVTLNSAAFQAQLDAILGEVAAFESLTDLDIRVNMSGAIAQLGLLRGEIAALGATSGAIDVSLDATNVTAALGSVAAEVRALTTRPNVIPMSLSPVVFTELAAVRTQIAALASRTTVVPIRVVNQVTGGQSGVGGASGGRGNERTIATTSQVTQVFERAEKAADRYRRAIAVGNDVTAEFADETKGLIRELSTINTGFNGLNREARKVASELRVLQQAMRVNLRLPDLGVDRTVQQIESLRNVLGDAGTDQLLARLGNSMGTASVKSKELAEAMKVLGRESAQRLLPFNAGIDNAIAGLLKAAPVPTIIAGTIAGAAVAMIALTAATDKGAAAFGRLKGLPSQTVKTIATEFDKLTGFLSNIAFSIDFVRSSFASLALGGQVLPTGGVDALTEAIKRTREETDGLLTTQEKLEVQLKKLKDLADAGTITQQDRERTESEVARLEKELEVHKARNEQIKERRRLEERVKEIQDADPLGTLNRELADLNKIKAEIGDVAFAREFEKAWEDFHDAIGQTKIDEEIKRQREALEKEAEKLKDSLKTPLEEMQSDAAKIGELLASGLLNANDVNRAVQELIKKTVEAQTVKVKANLDFSSSVSGAVAGTAEERALIQKIDDGNDRQYQLQIEQTKRQQESVEIEKQIRDGINRVVQQTAERQPRIIIKQGTLTNP